MLNEAVCSFPPFFLLFITFPLPQISCFVFFVLLSLVYSTWARVSLGHCILRNGAGTLLLLYISIVTTMPALRRHRHATSPPYPRFFFSKISFPPHMYFYQSSPVSSTCHLHRAVCLYPSMCIPYSISRCSLTLYGALAGHHRRCQSSFIRFCCCHLMIVPSPLLREARRESEVNDKI